MTRLIMVQAKANPNGVSLDVSFSVTASSSKSFLLARSACDAEGCCGQPHQPHLIKSRRTHTRVITASPLRLAMEHNRSSVVLALLDAKAHVPLCTSSAMRALSPMRTAIMMDQELLLRVFLTMLEEDSDGDDDDNNGNGAPPKRRRGGGGGEGAPAGMNTNQSHPNNDDEAGESGRGSSRSMPSLIPMDQDDATMPAWVRAPTWVYAQQRPSGVAVPSAELLMSALDAVVAAETGPSSSRVEAETDGASRRGKRGEGRRRRIRYDPSEPYDLGVEESTGDNAYHFAARYDRGSIVQVLRDFRIRGEDEPNRMGQTPLHLAAQHHCHHAAAALVKALADTSPCCFDDGGCLCRRTLSLAQEGEAKEEESSATGQGAAIASSSMAAPVGWGRRHLGALCTLDYKGVTPIHVAAVEGNVRFLSLVSQYLTQANPARCGQERKWDLLHAVLHARGTFPLGLTSLHLAAYGGHADAVRFLIEAHADPNVGFQHAQHPVTKCRDGTIRHVSRLFADERNAMEMEEVQAFASNHELHCYSECTATCGFDPREFANGGPLHVALRRFRRAPDIVEMLLKAGADPNEPETILVRRRRPLDTQAEGEDAPEKTTIRQKLRIVEEPQDIMCMRIALEWEYCMCDVEHDEEEQDEIWAAEIQTQAAMWAMLVRHGAQINAICDTEGNTVLHRAVRTVKSRYTVRAVRVLLGLGADPNALNKRGKTPLHLAAEDSITCPYRWTVALALLSGGARANIRDIKGQTPLEKVNRALEQHVLLTSGRAVAYALSSSSSPSTATAATAAATASDCRDATRGGPEEDEMEENDGDDGSSTSSVSSKAADSCIITADDDRGGRDQDEGSGAKATTRRAAFLLRRMRVALRAHVARIKLQKAMEIEICTELGENGDDSDGSEAQPRGGHALSDAPATLI